MGAVKVAITERPPRDVEVYMITHQHWDPAWAFQRRQILPLLPRFFEELLKRFRDYPSYRFVLDGQTHIIREYFKQLPPGEVRAKKKELSKYVKEGRLGVGPFYAQIDWNLTDGETWIRNLLIGYRDARELGRVMKIGWLIDIFGFPDAAPRVLRGFGIESIFFSRGVGVRREYVRDAYLWKSSSGDSVLAFYLIESYRNAIRFSKYPELAADRVLGEVRALLPYSSTGKTVLLLDGYENLPEADDVVPVIEDLKKRGIVRRITLCSPEEYVEAVKKHSPSFVELEGYLYHGKYATALRGVFSSRIDVKQLYMRCERCLIYLADPLSAILWCLGDEYPSALLDELWRRLLEAAFHDEICCCHIDDVSKDLRRSLGEVKGKCWGLVEEKLKKLAGMVDTSWVRGGEAVLVFNPSPWERRGVERIVIELPEGVEEFHLEDSEGRVVPIQVGRRDGRRVEVWFSARVPPLGYKVFALVPGSAEASVESPVKASGREAENEYVKVRVNEDGTLTVWDKVSGRVYDKLAYFKSEGEAGDLYTSYCLEGDVYTSLDGKAKVELIDSGPLAARFRIRLKMSLPEGLAEDRRSRSSRLREYPVVLYVELRAGSPRIDVRVELINTVKDHRLRICFPTKIETDRVYSQQQFDVAVFPIEPDITDYSTKDKCPLEGVIPPQWDTRPADGNVHHGFVDVTDGEAGFCVINKDVYEYWVEPEDTTVELTLVRGVGWLGTEIPIRAGRAGWGIRTPEAQCLGRHAFELSIIPHKGGWFEAKLHREARNRRLDLLVVQLEPRRGDLPSELSFFNLTSNPEGALEVVAVKRSEDGENLCVRVCNYLDREAEGRLKVFAALKEAYTCNLEEEVEEELPVNGGLVPFKVKGKGIATLKIKVAGEGVSVEKGDTRVITQSPLLLDDEWLRAELPPVITEEEARQDEMEARKYSEELERVRRELEELERRGYRESPSLEERVKYWEAKLRVIRAIEKKKDAEYSYLLDRKRLMERAGEEEKLRELQDEIDKLVSSLMDPRAESQVAIHVINCYKLLMRR